jgi:membrane protein DedA with SNARE-associated domain
LLLKLIRKHPFYGLIAGLMIEAWIAVPGEALIAIATAKLVRRSFALLQVVGAGVAGMLVNDVALYGISRLANGMARRLMHHAGIHLRLNGFEVLLAKFVPPLRSAAFVVYGFQGTAFGHFLWVSVLTSLAWVGAYMLLGRLFRTRILDTLHLLDSRGRWSAVVEVALTVATLLIIVRPF